MTAGLPKRTFATPSSFSFACVSRWLVAAVRLMSRAYGAQAALPRRMVNPPLPG